MLYKFGNSVTLDCGSFDVVIVSDGDVAKELENGWSLHPLECKKAENEAEDKAVKKRNTKAKDNVVD